MKQLEKILVPVDVNIDSKEQLNTAIEIARSYNSEIIIMYVLAQEVMHDDLKEILLSAISNSLHKIKETLRKEGVITNEPIIEYGRPVDKILKMATKEHVNLIVAGSGNKNKKDKFKLGNIVEKLIRHSDIPVWVAKPEKETTITNILCPVDFSDTSRNALKNAILLSKKFNASLRILSVFEPTLSISPRIKVDLNKENAYWLKQHKNEMQKFTGEFDLTEITHTIDILSGTIHEKILHTIEDYDHDLLIMGTTGRSGLRRVLMGSIAEKVTREIPCSFITVKTQDIIQSTFNNDVKELKTHFDKAGHLVEEGKYKEAISQYLICVKINNMHIPSIYKLAEVNRIIGRNAKAEYYDNMAKKLLNSLWSEVIEKEIRNHYNK
jgi:nucleotide-binding universal stress UspA family protein